MRKKGQALIFVLFVSVVAGLWTGTMAMQWQTDMKLSVLERDAAAAFYLAHAGIEQAKADLLKDVGAGPLTSAWHTELDPVPADTMVWEYQYNIAAYSGSPPPKDKTVTATGRIRDAVTGAIYARKTVTADLDGLKHTSGPGTEDSIKSNNIMKGYQEL